MEDGSDEAEQGMCHAEQLHPTLLRSTGKQKAFSRPTCNDISARQMLSRRTALSLDDFYILKLKVWIFLFDSDFFFANVGLFFF